MVFDLSFWRIVLFVSIARSGTWGKNGDTWLVHVGTFSRDGDTAVQIVLVFLSVQIGFASKNNKAP